MVAQFSLRLDGGVHAPAEARRYLRRFHGELDHDLLQVVSLLVSELVTNSVRHGGEGTIVLEAEVRPSSVRVEVGDDGPGFRPRALRPDPARGSGFGLYLVDEMADRWGVQATGGGSRVWFELDR